MPPFTVEHLGYTFTSDKALIPVGAVHAWLSKESYWVQDIPLDVVRKSFENSFTVGILKGDELVGYARLATDYARLAILADVFVTAPHRGQGLSKKMIELIMDLDWVKKLRSITLGTRDAQGLYARFGFVNPENPERVMMLRRPDIYTNALNTTT